MNYGVKDLSTFIQLVQQDSADSGNNLLLENLHKLKEKLLIKNSLTRALALSNSSLIKDYFPV